MKIMLSNHKAILIIGCTVLWFSLLFFIPAIAFSQDDRAAQHKILVGVTEAAPVYMKTADNRWVGFGVEIWQMLAQDMSLAFEFREFNTLESMLTALEKREIDIIRPCKQFFGKSPVLTETVNYDPAHLAFLN